MAGKGKAIRRRTPRQSRSQATLEAVLDASARILRKDGLAGFNTNRIAQVAGISIGTLYGYFPDKRAILIAMARRMLEEDRKAVEAALQSAPDQPVAAMIGALFARHAKDCTLRRCIMSAHLAEGLTSEHGESVRTFETVLADHPAFAMTAKLSLMLAVQAALGMARAITEGVFGETESSLERLIAEATTMIDAFIEPE